MGKGDYLGEFEMLVLSTLATLNRPYGMLLRLEIEERTGRPVSIGAIYATLRRLEAKGMISSELGAPTAERGGRAKRFFQVEPAGARAIRQAREMFTSLWEKLPESIG